MSEPDPDENLPVAKLVPIPPLLHSSEHDAPFSKCVACKRPLRRQGTGYIIEKAFKRDEVIFEHAICLRCREQISEELSIESRQRISSWFEQRVDLPARRRKLLSEEAHALEPWIDHCLISGRPRSELDEYLVAAQCDGADLVFAYLPFVIGGESTEVIASLLSEQTRDRLDSFVDDFLGLPPELRPFDLVIP